MTVGWKRGARLVFIHYLDESKWSTTKDKLERTFFGSYPSEVFSFIQDRNGKYRLAFIDFDQDKLWVAESNNPF